MAARWLRYDAGLQQGSLNFPLLPVQVAVLQGKSSDSCIREHNVTRIMLTPHSATPHQQPGCMNMGMCGSPKVGGFNPHEKQGEVFAPTSSCLRIYLYFPLLVLNIIYHYILDVFLIFFRGLHQMDAYEYKFGFTSSGVNTEDPKSVAAGRVPLGLRRAAGGPLSDSGGIIFLVVFRGEGCKKGVLRR